jgi:hypothetical protein
MRLWWDFFGATGQLRPPAGRAGQAGWITTQILSKSRRKRIRMDRLHQPVDPLEMP